ncbi:MAG: hypothetical protein ACLQVX_23795 [Limisphaerales bacterium]
MSQTLEQRVETLERKFSELSARLLNLRRPQKDWRATVGTLQNDELTQEAERLGREYRTQQTFEKEIAGS